MDTISAPSGLQIAVGSGRKDVRPLLQRNNHNAISRAELTRDQLYHMLAAACTKQGVEALIIKSPPFSSTVTVSLESWTGVDTEPAITDRGAVTITVRPTQFHRFECELDVMVQRSGRPRHYRRVQMLSEWTVEQLVLYALGRTKNVYFGFTYMRELGWQLWRPRNELQRVQTDWAMTLGFWMAIIGAFLIWTSYEIYDEYRHFRAETDGTAALWTGIVFAVIGVGLAVHRALQPIYFLSSGRPEQEPRRLISLDSWQTLVYGAGTQIDRLKTALRAELEHGVAPGFRLSDERIAYLGVDGKEERDQMVVTFRRGITFLHVYRYGDDAYVGWSSHVNAGTWVEKRLAAGAERGTGRRVQVNTIVSGWHIPSEYDVTDTNCLTEWTHATTTKVLKRFMEEQRIDQEIDFKILREERKGIVGRREEGKGAVPILRRPLERQA
jgi:hypothetical protein